MEPITHFAPVNWHCGRCRQSELHVATVNCEYNDLDGFPDNNLLTDLPLRADIATGG